MVSEGEQRHSTKSLVIFGVQFENSRSLPSDSTSLSSAAPADFTAVPTALSHLLLQASLNQGPRQ